MTRDETRESAYPVVAGDDDRRFTHGLIFDVARRIEQQGYPKIDSGPDVLRLQLALFRFLYRQEER